MPIEDAAAVWPEDESTYIAVARISIPKQLAWSEARAAVMDDGMLFTPWHAIAAHRPIIFHLRQAVDAVALKSGTNN